MLYKIGEVNSRLLGTNGFHIKVKSERFSATSSRCRQNLKHENFTSSFGRLRQNIAAKSVPYVQHDCFSSFNQSNHLFVALSLTLPSSNHKTPYCSVGQHLQSKYKCRKSKLCKLKSLGKLIFLATLCGKNTARQCFTANYYFGNCLYLLSNSLYASHQDSMPKPFDHFF